MRKYIASVPDQAVALGLTLVTCAALVAIFWLEISVLNIFTTDDIALHVRLGDVLIGMTIYLKTSIDFAIFIGRLMEKNPGLKGRIGIEVGTALGNALGTMAILLIWTFFKEVDWLLAAMIALAALVLIRMAQDSMEHIDYSNKSYPAFFRLTVQGLSRGLNYFNKTIEPFLSKIIPSHSMKVVEQKSFMALLATSFSVPFILGLDDFAGYVPLFNIVNVFGFGIGVFAGHMILNIFLYLSPKRTIRLVKNPGISFVGAVAFIGLAVWGLIEAAKLLTGHH